MYKWRDDRGGSRKQKKLPLNGSDGGGCGDDSGGGNKVMVVVSVSTCALECLET